MALGVAQVHVEGTRPLTSCGFECILVARPARAQPDAMASAASLTSLSFVGSTCGPKSPAIFSAKTPDRERGLPSRPGTNSSGSNSMTGFFGPAERTPQPSFIYTKTSIQVPYTFVHSVLPVFLITKYLLPQLYLYRNGAA